MRWCQLMQVQGSKIVTEAGEQVKGQLLEVLGEYVGYQWKCVIKRLVGCGESIAGCLHMFPSQEKNQSSMLGLDSTNFEHMSVEVRDYVRQQETYLHWALGLLHVLLSCTFLLVFHS